MLRTDWLLRVVEQLSQAVARAIGALRSGQEQEALQELMAAEGSLPLVPGLLDSLPAGELVKRLGPEGTRGVIALLEVKAELQRRRGRWPLAERADRRAAGLRRVLGAEAEGDALPEDLRTSPPTK